MVHLRKNVLYAIWLILIIILFYVNWIGINERQITSSIPTVGIIDMSVGDVDIAEPGDEIVYLTPSHVKVKAPNLLLENETYYAPDWESNPLVALSVGDFDESHKGDEIIILAENGTLILVSLNSLGWQPKRIGALPWSAPTWTTRTVIAGQLIVNSSSLELVIIGNHFDWNTQNQTGRVFVVSQVNNVTWYIDEIHLNLNPLYCAAVGDVDDSHLGLELLIAGQNTGVLQLAYNNGFWDLSSIFYWGPIIRSITIGNIRSNVPGYEIAIILENNAFILSKVGSSWDPDQIWRSSQSMTNLQAVLACNADPYHSGDELLAQGTILVDGRSVLIIFRHYIVTEVDVWTSHIYWDLFSPPTILAERNFDFNRDGTEVIIGNNPVSSILAVPNGVDRTIRAFSAVIVPAVILFPATVLLFALADYIGRAADRRRHQYALEMVAKGFVRCPYCKRFVPKDKQEAHYRWHRQRQLR